MTDRRNRSSFVASHHARSDVHGFEQFSTGLVPHREVDAATARGLRRLSAAQLGSQWRRAVRALGAAALAGTLVLSPLGAGLARAATTAPARFIERTGPANPLAAFSFPSNTTGLSFADIDADGDLDAFVGSKSTGIYYYENTGSATEPTFEERTGADNPFTGVGSISDAPNFGDLDGDGDLDAVVSGSGCFNGCPAGYQAYVYYENTGTPQSPVFEARSGGDNPFSVVQGGFFESPELIDIDGDGDLDAFVTYYDGTNGSEYGIALYTNTGGATTPAFEAHTGAQSLFPTSTSSSPTTPTFTDIDGDGDADAFVKFGSADIDFFENVGTPQAPQFVLQAAAVNPFENVANQRQSGPAFADLDGDGDDDAFVQRDSGGSLVFVYYENTGDVGLAATADSAEAGATAGTFVITRNNAQLTGPLALSYTLAGTATEGVDYTLVGDNNLTIEGGTITLADGAASGTIQVVPVDDSRGEGPETVRLTLTTAGSYLLDPGAAELSIVDNDPARLIYLPLVLN